MKKLLSLLLAAGVNTTALATDPAQYVFYTTSDGILHAVASYPDAADTAGGKELWAFMTEEALAFASGLMAAQVGEHIEVADGSPAIFFQDNNANAIVDGSDKVYLVFGLRRGGSTTLFTSAYYALDVTDINHPRFMWKIVGGMGVAGAGKLCAANGTCSAQGQFDELGQAWSTPALVRLRAFNDPVAIFGGGYDVNQDQGYPATPDRMGRALYVVDLLTGTPRVVFTNGNSGLVSAGGPTTISGMDFSIPSDVMALNTDLNSAGYVDRVYIGDTGGNLWRFDLGDVTTTKWTVKKLAALSGAALSGAMPDNHTPTPSPNAKRKILFPPAAVKTKMFNDANQRFDAVYVGTGDRENPTYPVSDDALFMVKDWDIGFTASWSAPVTPDGLTNIYTYGTSDTNADGRIDASDLNVTQTSTLKNSAGWYYPLPNSEKTASPPTVLLNRLEFSTYNPSEYINACSPAGKGQLYGMNAEFGGLAAPPASSNFSRAYPDFQVRGYIPAGGVVIRNKNIYSVHIAEGRLTYQLVGVLGGAKGVYWYKQKSN